MLVIVFTIDVLETLLFLVCKNPTCTWYNANSFTSVAKTVFMLRLLSLLSLLSQACGASSRAVGDAPRIEWSNVSFAVSSRQILRGVSGEAKPGRVLAIMGPSGSGKTTLLNALAGQVKASKGATLTGHLTIDGHHVGSAAAAEGVRQAFVRQEDIFYTQMTVRETLMFAARLRLPAAMDLEEKTARVDALLQRLGLVKVADTLIGESTPIFSASTRPQFPP